MKRISVTGVMMKKLFVLLFAFCAVVAVYGKERKNTYISVNLGVPLFWESEPMNGGEALKSRVASISADFSAARYFGSFFAIYGDIDVFFPLRLSTEMHGIRDTVGRSDYDTLFGISFLAGISLAPVRNDKLLLSVSPGFHYTYMKAENGVAGGGSLEASAHALGLGANVEFGYKITDLIFIRAAVAVAYDFIEFNTTTLHTPGDYSVSEDSGMLSLSMLTLKPQIGVGFNF